MNAEESAVHMLIARLRYLLERFENEFFHVHPDLIMNGHVKSLALSSILNEALNLHEAILPGKERFFPELKKWGEKQDWKWNEVVIRFTWWPICENLHPFGLKDSMVIIKGRDANNSVKHGGDLANLEDTMNACAAAWFLVLEKAREAKVFIGQSEMSQIFKIFDCYNFIDTCDSGYGYAISRPVFNKVCYPSVRGHSEIEEAKEAYEERYLKGKKKQEATLISTFDPDANY